MCGHAEPAAALLGTHPGGEFCTKLWVLSLLAVSRADELEKLLALVALQDCQGGAGIRGEIHESAEQSGGYRVAREDSSMGASLGDRLKKPGIFSGRRGLAGHPQATQEVRCCRIWQTFDGGRQRCCPGGDLEVGQSRTTGERQAACVGIGDGKGPLANGPDLDEVLTQDKLPGLRVADRGGQPGVVAEQTEALAKRQVGGGQGDIGGPAVIQISAP
ncbi:MAG TPA: hypothetical protein ENJ18_17570 [Nannocystis exedens]|nr:hypothetical protein [Nannocystis exedens]